VGTSTPQASRLRARMLRQLRILLLMATTCLALTGCVSGFQDQTNALYQPAAGITNRGHDVYVLDALVVTDGKGHGTLVGTLIDMAKTADSLQGVAAVDNSGQVIQTKLASPVPLPPQQAVKLETNATVRLTGTGLMAGYYIKITFTFANAAPLVMSIPVVPDGPDYTSIPVGPG
jgi:hypothetical protein